MQILCNEINKEHSKETKPRRGPTLHHLRYSYIWFNEQAGIPRKDSMMYTGHQTEATYQYYSISNEDSQKLLDEKRKKLLEQK